MEHKCITLGKALHMQRYDGHKRTRLIFGYDLIVKQNGSVAGKEACERFLKR
jgi:hypothetical protein